MARKKQLKPHETSYVTALCARISTTMPTWHPFVRTLSLATFEGRTFRTGGVDGQADVYVIVNGGRHLEIECKGVGGKLNEDQERWRTRCIEWGVPHIVLRVQKEEVPVETVRRWIAELQHFWACI